MSTLMTRPRRTLALTAAVTLAAGALAAAPVVAAPDDDQTTAVTAAIADAANVAPLAQPTASYTASWHVIDSVNNGTVSPTGGFAEAWSTWDGNRPASQWLEYTWEAPVTVDRSVMSFWTDGTAANGDNVRVPSTWKIQYWDASSSTYKDVVNPSAYGVARTTPNTTTFDAVTTTKIRATLNALQGVAPNPTTYSALGVTEWELWGTGGVVVVEPEDPNGPLEIEAVHVPTDVGVLPELPDAVAVTYLDGDLRDLAVAWESITLEDVDAAGSFTISGDVEGVAADAEATIWVRDGEAGAIEAVDPVSVITLIGTQPKLPTRVVAEYADGSRDSRVAVTWAAVDEADLLAEGFVFVTGDVEGTDLEAEALVWVIAPDDDEDTIAPTVTVQAAPNPGASGWYQEDVTITVSVTDNRDSDLPAEIQIGDGEFVAYDGPVVLDTDGITTVTARASDAAGNLGQTSRDLRIDATAPVTTASVVNLGSSVEVTLSAQDATSGVDRIQWEGPGTFWGTYQEPFTRALEAETQIIEFAATDAAGNQEVRQQLELPALTPDRELDIAVTALPRCVGAGATLALRATNGEDVPVAITLTTAHGERTVAAVAPGKAATQTFTVRAATLPAGTATVIATATIDGEQVTTTIETDYAATTCG